jgi:hypothetical protein
MTSRLVSKVAFEQAERDAIRRLARASAESQIEAASRIDRDARAIVAEERRIAEAARQSRRAQGKAPVASSSPTTCAHGKREYLPGAQFAEGEEIHHPAFGVGVVRAVARRRIEVEFSDGRVTLAASDRVAA